MLPLLLLLLLPLSLAQPCPSGAKYDEEKQLCYDLPGFSLSFQDAQMECVSRGGSLAKMQDSNEAFLIDVLVSDQSVDAYWVGGFQNKEGWTWMDWTPFTYTYRNWAVGEPSYPNGCVSVNTKNSKWSSVDCAIAQRYVCSSPAQQQCPSPPSPTSWTAGTYPFASEDPTPTGTNEPYTGPSSSQPSIRPYTGASSDEPTGDYTWQTYPYASENPTDAPRETTTRGSGPTTPFNPYTNRPWTTSPQHECKKCETGWRYLDYTDSCYVNPKKNGQDNFFSASDVCRGMNANLVSIHSPFEEYFVAGLTKMFYWLGVECDSRMDYSYLDGSPLDYKPMQGGDCFCVARNATANAWEFIGCGNYLPYVCKKPANYCE